MGKWLKADCGISPSADVEEDSIGLVAGTGFSVDLDVVVPALTLATIFSTLGGGQFAAAFFNIVGINGQDGVFGFDTDGTPTWQFNADRNAGAAAGNLVADTSFHITYTAAWNAGTSLWDIVVEIDGTPTLSYDTDAFGVPTDTVDQLLAGAIAGNGLADEIYYVDNVVLKDGSGSIVFSDDFESGDTSAWDFATTSATVVDFDPSGGGTPTAPTNTDCANAEELIGCAGTVTGDNRAWAGTWPVGADPLFNVLGEGGGTPLWYRWTNNRPRNMLFRVAVTEPDDHAVDYNLGLNTASDCAAVAFVSDIETLDIGYGPGVVFDINAGGGTRDGYAAADAFDPGTTTHFDIVVAPGDTVYLEIDSWTGDASEPPTADSAHRGKFKFEWSALEFTTRDTMQDDGNGSPADTVLADPVNTTYASFDTGSPHPIFPLELVRFGDRLYFLYLYNDEHGDSYYAGDCALDGTDLHTFLFIDKHTTFATPSPISPKLMYDGTDVYVGYGWRGTNLVPNPDYTDSCDNHTGETFFCFECTDQLAHWRYTLLKFDASTHDWDPFFSIGENAPDPAWAASLPDYGDVSGLSTSFFRCAASAAPEDPGVIWITTCYQRVRTDQSLHINDYPITETPTGAYWCTNDRIYMDEVVDIWRIETADVDGLGGGWTLASRDELEIFELQHWDHDDIHTNPAFATWQHFDDGNYWTDPGGTTYPSILRDHLSMVTDEGFPILAYNPIETEDNSGPGLTPGLDVIAERLDTASVLQDWDVGEISLGVDTPANAPTGISLTPRYFNPETEAWERGLSTTWYSVSFVPRGWLVRVPSDFSGAPTYINPDDSFSSGAVGSGIPLVSALYKDSKLGQFITSFLGLIDTYEYCTPAWERTFFGVGTQQYFVAPVFYWDPETEDAYYLADQNIIGKTHMLRDFWICEDGTPCVVGAIAGLRHHRQRLGAA